MKLSELKLNVVRFANEDVIATSFFAVANGDGYDIYRGVTGEYSDANGGWYVALDGSPINHVSNDDFEDYSQGLFTEPGLYEIYGEYYTKGATYSEISGQSVVSTGGQGASGGPTPGSGPALPGFGG